jgi:hypothetical protein
MLVQLLNLINEISGFRLFFSQQFLKLLDLVSQLVGFGSGTRALFLVEGFTLSLLV